MRPKNRKKIPNQCKALTRSGNRCRSRATLDGYCMAHWFVARKKYGLKYSQKPRNTPTIKEKRKKRGKYKRK